MTFAFVSEFAGKLTVPADTVKPLEAVNVIAQVIVFEVKSPEFVIDPDVEAPVLVIVFDDKAPVLFVLVNSIRLQCI